MGPSQQLGGRQDVLDPLLAVQPANPPEDRYVRGDVPLAPYVLAAPGVELAQVDHRRDLHGVPRPVRHA